MGNRLLTALAGLFVSYTNEDIRIEFTALEPGFQVKDSKVKVWKTGKQLVFMNFIKYAFRWHSVASRKRICMTCDYFIPCFLARSVCPFVTYKSSLNLINDVRQLTTSFQWNVHEYDTPLGLSMSDKASLGSQKREEIGCKSNN